MNYMLYDNYPDVAYPPPIIRLITDGSGSGFAGTKEAKFFWKGRSPVSIEDVDDQGNSSINQLDVRTVQQHLENIRNVLRPAITDLATVCGVSRQAVYKWLGGETTPESDKGQRIQTLSHAADSFRDAGIIHASSLWKMKLFAGHSLMDLVANDELSLTHIQSLIDEAKTMQAAYDRSGLATSKAKPSEDWRSEISVPGFPEP